MTFPFFFSCYAKNCNPKVTAAALNMLQRLLCGEKASRSSFCPPYGTIVLVMPHEAAPSRVLLLALLVENKLLVSKGKREARGHRGAWDEGAPVRMLARLHPMVSGQPGGGVERVLWAGEGKLCSLQSSCAVATSAVTSSWNPVLWLYYNQPSISRGSRKLWTDDCVRG